MNTLALEGVKHLRTRHANQYKTWAWKFQEASRCVINKQTRTEVKTQFVWRFRLIPPSSEQSRQD